jgi:hypothetical protein
LIVAPVFIVAALGLGSATLELAIPSAEVPFQEADGSFESAPVAPSWSKCPQWFDTAMRFWPVSQWPIIDHILHRESRCLIDAFNPKDTNGKPSYSLFQVNAFWCSPVEYYTGGFLQEKRILSTCDDLFDVDMQFAAARAIYVEGLTRHG